MRKLLLIILGVVANMQISYGAIAFVSSSTPSNNQATAATTAWTNTCGAGTNFVIVTSGYIHTGQSITGITLGTDNLTKIYRFDNALNVGAEMWYDATNTTSAQTITITYSASTIQQPRAGAICLSGVDTSSPIGATSTAGTAGGATTVSITTTTDNSWVFDTDSTNDTLGTPNSPQVLNWVSYNGSGGFDVGSSQKSFPTHGATTMSWNTTTAPAQNWAILAVEIKPLTVAVSTPSSGAMLRFFKFR